MSWDSREDSEASPAAVKGLFWLGFDGPMFMPIGPDGAPLWSCLRVNISEVATTKLACKLGMPAAELQSAVDYEVEFRGYLSLNPLGSGDLDAHGGSITVLEVLSAKLPVQEGSERRYGSIRNALLGIRSAVSGNH